MKIIFMGNPSFACPSLRVISKSSHDLVGVISNPPKRMKRSMALHYTPLGKLANDLNQNLFTIENLYDPSLESWIRKLKPDLIVVVAFKFLPNSIIEIPKMGAINLHASLLPKYRGAAPIQHALINNDKETGNTTFFIQSKIDTGNIILQEKVKIDIDDNFESLSEKMSLSGADLLLKSLNKVNSPNFISLKQDSQKATFAPKIDKTMCRINWNESAQMIHSKVKALSPSPGAFTIYNNKRLKIFDTKIVTDSSINIPGSINHINNRILISCSDYNLELKNIQYEGKKRMPAIDWFRGVKISTGIKFD